MAQKAIPITSERQRALQSLTFAESSILTRDLPRDTCLKHIQLRLSGSVVTTFASGTPVADAQSIFDNIIPRIDVQVDGSRIVKSVRPHLMQMQSLITTGQPGVRRCSAGAAAATDNLPTVDAGWTYGTTTQITTAAETVLLSFENVYATNKELTWLNLKGRSSAEIKLATSSFSKLLGYGNTAPVVFTDSTFVIELLTVEAMDIPAEMSFSDWKQTTKQVLFSAETTDFPVDINRGNYLQAIMLFAQSGAAGSATTATGKVASNLALTKLQLLVNGQNIIKTTNFKASQDEMRQRYGLNAPLGTNVSRLDGVTRLDFLRSGDINTALPTMSPVVDNLQLVLSTNTAANVAYTVPVGITIMTEEIVRPR